jgi:hypothetical protein
MNIYTYRVIREVALDFYKENGMEVHFDTELFNGVLSIEAPDEETADKIRMTFSDIRMWEKIEDEVTLDMDEIVANGLIASTILSETAQKDLEGISPEIRFGIEALIADGLIVERDGKYRTVELGFDDDEVK